MWIAVLAATAFALLAREHQPASILVEWIVLSATLHGLASWATLLNAGVETQRLRDWWSPSGPPVAGSSSPCSPSSGPQVGPARGGGSGQR